MQQNHKSHSLDCRQAIVLLWHCVCMCDADNRVAVSMNHYHQVSIGGNSSESDEEIMYGSSAEGKGVEAEATWVSRRMLHVI